MSSIYDALQRIQAQKATLSTGVLREDSSSRTKIFWLVLISIIISSAGTAALFYGVRTLKDGNGEIKNETVQTKASTLSEARSLTEQGDPLHEGGDSTGEIERYVQAISVAPDKVDAYLKLGGLYYESGDYDRALLTYTKALRYFRSDARILNNIGSVLLAKGDMDKAIGYFVHANRISKDFVEPVYNMACAYAKNKNPAEALSAFKKAYALNPEVRLWAIQDPDLEYLRGNMEFDAIIHLQ
jgi:tetratricopeptide (TPR) repeat protein